MYPTPFSSVKNPVCVDQRWHLAIPDVGKMAEGIRRYWSTYFYHPPYRSLKNILQVKGMEEWAQLTRRQVIRRLKFGKHNLDDMINEYERFADRWNR